MDRPDSPPLSPPPSLVSQGEADYGVVLDMVQNLKDKLSALNLDNDNIRAACDALRRQCQDQGVAFGDLTRLVRKSLDGRPPQRPQTETGNRKNICGLWFGLKRIGSSKPSLRCVPISPASATPKTSTDRRNRCSHWRRTTTGRRRCSPWWIVHSGTHRGQRNHLCHRNYNRCSPSHVAWDRRCDRLLASPTPLAGHRVPRHHRVKDIVHRFDLVATTPR